MARNEYKGGKIRYFWEIRYITAAREGAANHRWKWAAATDVYPWESPTYGHSRKLGVHLPF